MRISGVSNSATIGTEKHGFRPLAAIPRWVTAELVADTIETWQPHYDQPLTEGEAMEILISVGELVTALESN